MFASLAAFTSTVGGVMYMHAYAGGGAMLSMGIASLIYAMVVWWRDVVREATYQGHHTVAVARGLRYGMLLFILSEVMFFVAFFWAFFHASLAPAVGLGAVWPPVGIQVLDPWGLPALNTAILLTSGASVTWAHHALVAGYRQSAVAALVVTVALAAVFTAVQGFEYVEAPFSISDGVYGSTFYMATGFHGFHVLVGTLFLAVCLVRARWGHFTPRHHVGFEAAAWYWHFVDVVWLILFVAIYWWGGA